MKIIPILIRLHLSFLQIKKQACQLPILTLNSGPYIEVSAGIMNIFKLVRVDLVKRLSYLNHTEVTKWGIRTREKMDF